jgi:hypothetical protein
MRNILIVAIIALSVPSAAFGTRWVSVVKDDKQTFYIDLDAVVFDGRVATIWLKTQLTRPSKKGPASKVEKWMHDCESDRAKLLAITIYKANGNVMGSGEAPHYTQDWQRSSANAHLQAIHRRICEPSPEAYDTLDTSPTTAPTS